MTYFVEQYPLVATAITFLVAVIAGALDLIVLRNRLLAVIFWLWGLPATVMPIYLYSEWTDVKQFVAVVVGLLYLAVVFKLYGILAPSQTDDQVDADTDLPPD